MRLKPAQFYRKVGVRTRQQFTKPRLTPLTDFRFPLSSVYHFWPMDGVTLGPNPQDPVFDDTARVFIEHHKEPTDRLGGPRRTVTNPQMLENEYRRKNRLFKPLRKDAALVINPRNLLVQNYGLLSSLYRYIPSYKSTYHRWHNIAATVWDNVEACHHRFGWEQFIDLVLPERIPTLQELRLAEGGINQRVLSVFTTPADFNLLDFWVWLSDNRDASLMSRLSEATLEKTHFVIRVSGYFFVLNLARLDRWRKDPDDERDTGVAGSVLQRQFIKLLHGLRDLQAGVTEPETQTDDASPDPDDTESTPTERDTLPDASTSAVPDDLLAELDPPEWVSVPTPITASLDTPVFDTPPEKAQADTTTQLADPPEATGTGANERTVWVEGIADQAGTLLEAGLMSPKAYDRALGEATTYQALKDPYGSGQPLEDLLTVTQEDLEIPEVTKFPDRATIPDKSMLSSKLKAMQQGYTKKLLHKDVVSSVMSVQKLGVSVKDYQIETVYDEMNHYQIHTVTVKPVRGRQSTLRFRLPVVDEDGRFISNGVVSRLRTQRADVPIRKVKPTRVALTSYYNKTFIDRSTKVADDYARWLQSTLVTIGLDENDTRITQLRLSNTFNQLQHLPRIYTTLSQRVGSFTAGSTRVFVDYDKRMEHLLDTTGLDGKVFETGGFHVIGAHEDRPLLVDDNNTFYVARENETVVLGTIHDITGIALDKAPTEVAEMSVANKSFPVGLVLAYQLGLSGLIELLGAEVSRFRRGERIAANSDEYRLTFSDEVLVFSRLDQDATMILSGVKRYHQSLKQFSVWDFDQQDVYYRLLEDIGLGVRYLREIDTLFKAWVDPITEGLLKEMNEPTTFQGLLLRGVELLKTDYSPEEVSGEYMRYRGYERFAGMVYNELTRSAKTFNAKAGVGENSVELNPHAVWQKIVQDPAVAPVEESNPFANMREQEVMTYRGDGGRGGKSMVERTRKYHDADVGVVSESTVDSGDVGVVAYLSPDANFTSLRGTTRRLDKATDGPTTLLSSSSLNAPCVDHDDAKRINS